MLRNHVSKNHVAGGTANGATIFDERIALGTMELSGGLRGRINRGQKYIFWHDADGFLQLLGVILGIISDAFPPRIPPEKSTPLHLQRGVTLPVSAEARCRCPRLNPIVRHITVAVER